MITLKNFISLTKEEQLLVLKWRNDINVRKWMYTSSIITTREHEAFIKSLHTDVTKHYFLVKDTETPIGVIYFIDITNKDCAIGLYANPNTLNQGIGSLLMNTIITYVLEALKVNVLKAEVFADNTRAKTLYEKFGFYEKERIHINEKEVICMERINENR